MRCFPLTSLIALIMSVSIAYSLECDISSGCSLVHWIRRHCLHHWLANVIIYSLNYSENGRWTVLSVLWQGLYNSWCIRKMSLSPFSWTTALLSDWSWAALQFDMSTLDNRGNNYQGLVLLFLAQQCFACLPCSLIRTSANTHYITVLLSLWLVLERDFNFSNLWLHCLPCALFGTKLLEISTI